MKKLFLTRRLPDKVMTFLETHFILSYNKENRALKKNEIIDNIKQNDILLCLLTDQIDRDILKANPELLGVCNYAVGYNNIDLDAASFFKIPVTNTPGILTNTTAEHTFALLFACARRIVEADQYCRNDKFNGWEPELLLGHDLMDKKIMIVGKGRIGKRVGEIASAFGMNHGYFSKHDDKILFDYMLQNADFITLHIPLTASSYHFFGKREFDLMKSNSILINTSRGAVIDEDALVIALKEKQIAGAALDVFEFEPKISTQLKTMKNVVLTPHIGSGTIETRTKMGIVAGQNALDIANQKIPRNIINRKIYLSE